jgi:formylglycine-generating enzyme required for sulfatase activity
MRIASDFVRRSGYRLPTVLEWEYACRAGSVTRWSFGEAEDLLPKYGWGQINSLSRLHPVGTLRPNDLGLFDMYGNAWEWCQDREATAGADRPAAPDGVVTDVDHRLARGGAFGHGTLSMQSSNDVSIRPSERGGDLGFRPARTFRGNGAGVSPSDVSRIGEGDPPRRTAEPREDPAPQKPRPPKITLGRLAAGTRHRDIQLR